MYLKERVLKYICINAWVPDMQKELFKTQINTINIKNKVFSGKQYLFIYIFCTLKELRMKQTQWKLYLSFSKVFKVLLLNFTDLFENWLELLYCQTGNSPKDHKQKGNKKDCIFVTAVIWVMDFHVLSKYPWLLIFRDFACGLVNVMVKELNQFLWKPWVLPS